jgi:4-hydroxybenzoate polyprenyltransferase
MELPNIQDYLMKYSALRFENNLRRGKKLKKLTESYGKKGFDYIGNSFSDLEVWAGSRYALLINTKKRIQKEAEKNGNVSKIFEFEKTKFSNIIKEIRVYQWVKNLLLFFPLILAHEFTNFNALITLFFAFFSFSFTASSVYVVNDLLDLESDRVHSTKKNRPFASGSLPVHYGAMLAPILLILGFLISGIFVSVEFTLILLAYFILTTLYSFQLKKLYVIDIIVLASLYSLRIFAGGVASEVFISPWLISFSVFFFVSLSVVKRYTEILSIISKNKSKAKGRGYTASDKSILLVSGVASGLISVMIFTLYLNSPEVKIQYQIPELLYIITPLLLYAILRIWFKTDRDEMTDDPIIFFIKDKPSLIILILIFLIVIGASV